MAAVEVSHGSVVAFHIRPQFASLYSDTPKTSRVRSRDQFLDARGRWRVGTPAALQARHARIELALTCTMGPKAVPDHRASWVGVSPHGYYM